MAYTAEATINSDDDIEAELGGLLNRKLLTIFSSPSNNQYQIGITPAMMLREAYSMSRRVRKENLDNNDFHLLYDSAKQRLGTYHAASISMMMLYAILFIKEDQNLSSQLLQRKIANKYKLRPQMREFITITKKLEHMNVGDSDIHITLNLNNQFTGEIKELNVNSPGNIVGKEIKM